MLTKEKLKEISTHLSADRTDYISAFRKNLFMYIEEKDITIKDISEASGVPFSTLNTFLYGDSKDAKLSTAVKLGNQLRPAAYLTASQGKVSLSAVIFQIMNFI